MKKNIIKMFISLIIIFLLLSTLVYFINKSRFSRQQDPILCFNKNIANDGGTTEYHYLTYTIIKYKNIFNDDIIYVMGDSSLKYNNPFYDKNSKYYIPQ